MSKLIHAHTHAGASYPAFVNVSRHDSGSEYTITVRSDGNGGRNLGQISLNREQMTALFVAISGDLLGTR